MNASDMKEIVLGSFESNHVRFQIKRYQDIVGDGQIDYLSVSFDSLSTLGANFVSLEIPVDAKELADLGSFLVELSRKI